MRAVSVNPAALLRPKAPSTLSSSARPSAVDAMLPPMPSMAAVPGTGSLSQSTRSARTPAAPPKHPHLEPRNFLSEGTTMTCASSRCISSMMLWRSEPRISEAQVRTTKIHLNPSA